MIYFIAVFFLTHDLIATLYVLVQFSEVSGRTFAHSDKVLDRAENDHILPELNTCKIVKILLSRKFCPTSEALLARTPPPPPTE